MVFRAGLWHDDSPEDNPRTRADGLVEVPKWRYALINIAHPLFPSRGCDSDTWAERYWRGA
jgi:hypothetical protein